MEQEMSTPPSIVTIRSGKPKHDVCKEVTLNHSELWLKKILHPLLKPSPCGVYGRSAPVHLTTTSPGPNFTVVNVP